MLKSIILACCSSATYTLDTGSANETASSSTSTTTVASTVASTTYYTMVTIQWWQYSTSSTFSTKHTSTSTMAPTTSWTSTATSTSWSIASSATASASSTSFLSTNRLATQNLSFAGDYATVVGSNKALFLEECSASLAEAACIDVHAGSVIVTLQGLPSALTIAKAQLQASGLDLPSFYSLNLEMTKTASVSTTISTTTMENKTSSQSGASADDGFIVPLVVVAGSLGGLCLSLACCYGLLVFRRRRRKQAREVAQPSDNTDDSDCIVLSVQETENPQESSRDLKDAPHREMIRQDLSARKLQVEASPQESQEPAANTPVETDQWKLDLPDDIPEAVPAACHAANRGRTSL